MGRKITIIDFEPDWSALYIDGELEYEGHSYNKKDWLKELLEDGGFEVTGEYYNPEQWRGTPSSPEEAEEVYGD